MTEIDDLKAENARLQHAVLELGSMAHDILFTGGLKPDVHKFVKERLKSVEHIYFGCCIEEATRLFDKKLTPPPRGTTEETVMDSDYLLQFFGYKHLPDHMQVVSKPFGDLAQKLVETLPPNEERHAALRKLLEAKDAAVRAVIFK